MNAHEFLDDDLRDQAVRHALGTLADPEARLYRMHLLECGICRSEADSLSKLTRELVLVAPSETPPPQLWEHVLKRIKSPRRPVAVEPDRTPPAHTAESSRVADTRHPTQIWKSWEPRAPHADGSGLTYVPSEDHPFESTGAAGVDVRRLFVDREQKRVTLLVRMAAGSSYPAHEHAGPEECYVLQGDLRVGDLHMHAGDFQRADEGSLHGEQSTDDGCLLLIVSSLEDRLVR